ncbi:MAG: cytochrome P450 [Alphaproteobacteria bacterium]
MTMPVPAPAALGPATDGAPRLEDWNGRLPEDVEYLADMHGWARLLGTRMPMFERPMVSWVFRYALVERLMNHPKMRPVGMDIMALRGITEGPLFEWWDRIVLMAHGERHTRLRAPLQRTFAFPVIAQRRERVRGLIDQRLDELTGAGEIDFIEEIAAQIPTRAICDLLGVPQADIPVFKAWADTLGQAFGMLTAEDVGPVDDAVTNLTAYVQGLVADRRANPREDFLTAFIQSVGESGAYSEDELLAQILGLIFAGSDTTRTALTVAMTLLLQHQDQWTRLIAERGLMRQAVDETLRFEPTVGSLPRFATEDIEIDGITLPGDQVIVLAISAAQRDPERYDAPNRFDITRADLPRMAIGFGGGPHRCLGEMLARIEIEETLDAIATRFPQVDFAGPLPHFVALATGIRKLEGLRVRI